MFAGRLFDAGVQAAKDGRPMTTEDMLQLPQEEECVSATQLFESSWEELKATTPAPTINAVIRKTYRKDLFLGFFGRLLHEGSNVALPFVFQLVVRWYLDTDAPLWEGIVLLVAFCALSLLSMIFMAYGNEFTAVMFQKIRTALQAMVFKKSLKLRGDHTSNGTIVALHGSDLARLKEMMWIHALSTAPFSVTANVVALYILIGPAGFLVVAVLLLAIPSQGFVSSKIGTHVALMMKEADVRLKYVSEVVQGMRICKFMGWERNFEEAIEEVRSREVTALGTVVALRNIVIGITHILPQVLQLVVFGGAYGFGQEITADRVFPTLVMMMSFRGSVMGLSLGVSKFVDLLEITRRTTDFLLLPERTSYVTLEAEGDTACHVSNATFGYETLLVKENTTSDDSHQHPISSKEMKSTEPIAEEEADEGKVFRALLKDITLACKKGTLTIITGPTGAGKSVLINAILGEGVLSPNPAPDTRVIRNGEVAYVPQEAWILNGTVKDNITLFEPDLDEDRYEAAIRSCSLSADLEMLPAGDLTEIGERGINLSGGQKQRLALARATYCRHDLVLLDDPLSAVDPQVCSSLFNDCISGEMSGRTRVLVTHHVQFLPMADQVVVLKKGEIVFAGSYEEYLEFDATRSDGASDHGSPQAHTPGVGSPKPATQRADGPAAEAPTKQNPEAGQKLMSDERQEQGGIKFGVYTWYAGLAHGGWAANCLLGFLAWRVGQTISDIWLQLWTTRAGGFGQDSYTQNQYMLWFGVAAVGGMVGTTWRQWGMTKLVTQISSKSHRPLLHRVLHAPMEVFDTTPTGRMLNRFSKDLQALDLLLPEYGNFFLSLIFNMVGVFGLVLFTAIYLLPVFLILSIIFYQVLVYYTTTLRAVKRVENVERSPMMAIMSEVLNGQETIRAFGLGKIFEETHDKRTDKMMIALYNLRQAYVWLVSRTTSIGFLGVLAVAAIAIVYREVPEVGEATLDPQWMILALAYVQQITPGLAFIVLMGAEVDSQMSSAERIKEYIDELPQEKVIAYDGEDREVVARSAGVLSVDETHPAPPQAWPSSGRVELTDVHLRYRPGLPLVLKGITATIESGMKVGVVGRTGSGKSTIMLALFRFIELASGSIKVDGHDISQLKLEDLRQQITIIPQDPTLFEGTIRSNLDPFNKRTDDELWAALSEVRLDARVKAEKDEKGKMLGLQSPVAARGANFSVGQRQLMCLARALLRRSHILLMDEATASVDFEADAVLQETIRVAFRKHTIITIAHRLATVIHSDRIMVLHDGTLMEFDTPHALLHSDGSIFQEMVDNLGEQQALELAAMAAEATPM